MTRREYEHNPELELEGAEAKAFLERLENPQFDPRRQQILDRATRLFGNK